MDNQDPLKINLVTQLCKFFYHPLKNKAYALEMAKNFMSFIKTEKSQEAL